MREKSVKLTPEERLMDLYLIRHADALVLGERGINDDEERPLSEEGEAQARSLSLMMQHRAGHLEAIFTSPLKRARQTGELIVQDWSGAPELQNCDPLAMGGKRKALARFLRQWGGNSAALIGHQPDLAEFAGWLLGCKKARIDLEKAGVALVQCSERPGKGSGTLAWLVTPEWFMQGAVAGHRAGAS
jgi:phosphohistidine phosphatase